MQRGLGESGCAAGRGVKGTGRLGLRGGRGHLQVPAWYLRALTLCLWAANVRTRSPVSASQHLTVLSALPEYTCRFTSWGGGGGREGRHRTRVPLTVGGTPEAPPNLSLWNVARGTCRSQWRHCGQARNAPAPGSPPTTTHSSTEGHDAPLFPSGPCSSGRPSFRS